MKIYLLKTLLFITLCLITNLSSYSQTQKDTMVNNSRIYTGEIIKVNFVDKACREHKDSFNYFFETEDKQYFIKISEGNVSREELAKYYNKKIKVRAVIILFGLWDTNDPNVQSRVGDYLIFKEIL